MQPHIAHRFHAVLEPLAATIFFAPEAVEEYARLGLDGFQGYFCSRAAPMGRVSAEVVSSTFFSFAPAVVRSGLRWDIAAPEDVLGARIRAARACMTRLIGDGDGPDVRRVVALLRAGLDSCRPEGRPLFAAHAGLPWPDDDATALWHAALLLREYRGDGHIAVLVSHGIDAVEALALDAAFSDKPGAYFEWRQWPAEDTDDARERLIGRGFLSGDGTLTDGGAKFREMIENETDRLAAPPYLSLGLEACEEALVVLTRLVEQIVERRGVPRFIARLFAATYGT